MVVVVVVVVVVAVVVVVEEEEEKEEEEEETWSSNGSSSEPYGTSTLICIMCTFVCLMHKNHHNFFSRLFPYCFPLYFTHDQL